MTQQHRNIIVTNITALGHTTNAGIRVLLEGSGGGLLHVVYRESFVILPSSRLDFRVVLDISISGNQQRNQAYKKILMIKVCK